MLYQSTWHLLSTMHCWCYCMELRAHQMITALTQWIIYNIDTLVFHSESSFLYKSYNCSMISSYHMCERASFFSCRCWCQMKSKHRSCMFILFGIHTCTLFNNYYSHWQDIVLLFRRLLLKLSFNRKMFWSANRRKDQIHIFQELASSVDNILKGTGL